MYDTKLDVEGKLLFLFFYNKRLKTIGVTVRILPSTWLFISSCVIKVTEVTSTYE